MKYQYCDVWVRRPDGSLAGCQLSYSKGEYRMNIDYALAQVKDLLLGETDVISLPPGFRLWNPGKIDTKEVDSPCTGNRGGSDWRTPEEKQSAAIAEYGDDDDAAIAAEVQE